MKFFNSVKNVVSKMFGKVGALVTTGVAIVASSAPKQALAVGTDYSALTSAGDFTTAATAIVTIFAALALAIVAWKGGKMVLSALRG